MAIAGLLAMRGNEPLRVTQIVKRVIEKIDTVESNPRFNDCTVNYYCMPIDLLFRLGCSGNHFIRNSLFITVNLCCILVCRHPGFLSKKTSSPWDRASWMASGSPEAGFIPRGFGRLRLSLR